MPIKNRLTIIESQSGLKQLFHNCPFHLHARIQMLYLIKSGVTDSANTLCEKLLVTTRAIQN